MDMTSWARFLERDRINAAKQIILAVLKFLKLKRALLTEGLGGVEFFQDILDYPVSLLLVPG